MVLALIADLATWFLVGLLAGVLLYIGGFAAVQPFGRERREQVGHWYLSQALRTMQQAAVVKTDYGLKMSGLSRDTKLQGQKLSDIDGDTPTVEDKGRLVSRLCGRPFAIADKRYNSAVDPVHLQIAHHIHDEWADGDSVWDRDDGRTLARIHYHVPDRPEIVDPGIGEALQTGAAEPEWAEQAKENAIISQEKFGNNMSVFDIMLFGILYLIGSGSIWFFLNYGSSASGAAGGADVSLPGTLLVDAVVLAGVVG